ncbi:MAG: type I DNA topoisomerase [Alphaproteobacteria bacterium]
MNVVVVESPAKARTINKYLGSEYVVLPSYGHVRDLPPKDGSVRPDEDFAMDWEVDAKAEKALKEISNALRGASKLFLATDPDREGEAISWHIEEILRERDLLNDVEVKRVVFNEITAAAVREAFSEPGELNQELIDAYLARRALDYLVGFTLSPVLWRKLPGARSAGRVQSVALRLVCEREAEIEAFKPREYWTVDVALKNARGEPFTARLTHLDGARLGKFDLANGDAAHVAKGRIEEREFRVAQVERKRTKRNPQPPFTTSTLQQEASRKLGFSATRTMRVAQRLYEGVALNGETAGLITYMRTDSVTLSREAIAACRELIATDYGDDYLPPQARVYKTKAKNAQEAHEAIRPTDLQRRPSGVAASLGKDEQRLYELVWRRTVASEMASAEIDKVGVDIDSHDGRVRLRANGSTTAFDGFLKLYREDRDDAPRDDETAEDEERRLPALERGEATPRTGVSTDQHFTQPPPRYSEASLVKRLEELGIGRPSTYASILERLQGREYVRLEKRRFVPEDRGRVVTSFLTSFFQRYVEYDFTARMEDSLDDVSGGRLYWKAVLRDFWEAFSRAVTETSELRTRAVLEALDQELGPHFFPIRDGDRDPRECPSCGTGRLGLRLGKHGPFIGCSNYPECSFTRRLAVDNGAEPVEVGTGPKLLGIDPETGKDVTLRKGPYGPYVQLGEPEGKEKPKRGKVPDVIALDEIDLRTALALLALPREVGVHPDKGGVITAGIGRFGPYLKHGGVYVSLDDPRDALFIQNNRAPALIDEKGRSPRRAATPLRELGDHPDDGKPVSLYEGRYGPYVKHGRLNATIPKDRDPDDLTLDEALVLLAARAERKKAGRRKTSRGRSAK